MSDSVDPTRVEERNTKKHTIDRQMSRIERAALAVDSVATRGAARAWLAALLRVAGLCIVVAFGPGAVLDLGEAVLDWLRQDISASPTYGQDVAAKVVQALRTITPAVAVAGCAVTAMFAGRIAAWAFPFSRRCHACGYAIGRLDLTDADARCPECGSHAEPGAA